MRPGDKPPPPVAPALKSESMREEDLEPWEEVGGGRLLKEQSFLLLLSNTEWCAEDGSSARQECRRGAENADFCRRPRGRRDSQQSNKPCSSRAAHPAPATVNAATDRSGPPGHFAQSPGERLRPDHPFVTGAAARGLREPSATVRLVLKLQPFSLLGQ